MSPEGGIEPTLWASSLTTASARRRRSLELPRGVGWGTAREAVCAARAARVVRITNSAETVGGGTAREAACAARAARVVRIMNSAEREYAAGGGVEDGERGEMRGVVGWSPKFKSGSRVYVTSATVHSKKPLPMWYK